MTDKVSIFGTECPKLVIDDDDEALDEIFDSDKHHLDVSELHNLSAIYHCSEEGTNDSSPPPPEFPTWDTIPFSNLPDVVGSSFASGYDFRPGPRIGAKTPLSTWLDQDGTATYHPDCKQDPYLYPPIEISEGIKRVRPIHPYEGLTRAQAPRTITWQHGRFEGKRLPVTISFTSQKGKATLASFG